LAEEAPGALLEGRQTLISPIGYQWTFAIFALPNPLWDNFIILVDVLETRLFRRKKKKNDKRDAPLHLDGRWFTPVSAAH
jgi:hypothetical protein